MLNTMVRGLGLVALALSLVACGGGGETPGGTVDDLGSGGGADAVGGDGPVTGSETGGETEHPDGWVEPHGDAPGGGGTGGTGTGTGETGPDDSAGDATGADPVEDVDDPGGVDEDALPSGLPDAVAPEEVWTPPFDAGPEVGLACKSDVDCATLESGNPCLAPQCHIQSGTCFLGAAPEGTWCDDHDPCTDDDLCVGGSCFGTAVECDDDDPCTDDVCRPEEGCVSEPGTGAACDDDDPCTTGDGCVEGVCGGAPKSCWDDDPCTIDVCAPATGQCVYIHDVDACDDEDPPPPAGDCCEPHDDPGCGDEGVEACVCEADAFCCETSWDGLCVDAAGADCEGCGDVTPVDSCGDGACGGSETCDACPEDCGECPPAGDCCTATAAAGCTDATVEACVCDEDAFCCETSWDAICVSAADTQCGACGDGPPEPSCGDGSCDPDEACGTCPADCGPCGPICGDGACTGGESCADCATDCGTCPEVDCCVAQAGPGCATDAALEACVCGLDAFCCETTWDAICAGEAKNDCGECGGEAPHCGDGLCQGAETCASCEMDCGECEGPVGCATPALLEIVALDAWAQPLAGGFSVTLVSGGELVPVTPGTLGATALCEAAAYELVIEAPDHHEFAAAVVYDGSTGWGGVSVQQVGEPSGVMLTTEVSQTAEGPLRVYTLWVGLVHRWFAATGPPARHGNHVELLRDGEETWAAVYADLLPAESLVTASTWWWTSDLELIRDPDTHIYLPQEERWQNTVLGVMESLGWQGVETKVLVNQFYSQDGLLGWITSDGELTEHAETPFDGIEVMGQANETTGQFTVTLSDVDFADRVLAGWSLDPGADLVATADIPAVVGPQAVDVSELPLFFDALDVPVASWHQKFLTIDQEIAYIGGMNIKVVDWDTHAHGVFEPRRMAFDATYEERLEVLEEQEQPTHVPRKDFMVRIAGPSAADAVNVFGARWAQQREAGVEYAELTTAMPSAKIPAAKAGGVQAQVVSTMPAPHHRYAIMDTLIRAIGQAEHYIYIEDQYLRAPLLADAIVDRMLDVPGLVLLIVNTPVSEWYDPGCFQTYLEAEKLFGWFPDRVASYQVMSYEDRVADCTFCIDEVDALFVPMSLHSKLVLIDDHYLQTGSANHNNRGLLYEGELATVVVDTATATQARHAIFANLLGPWYSTLLQPQDFLPAFEQSGYINLTTYEAWDAEGFDLDLDGEPVPMWMVPDGFVYPLEFGSPDECLIENVGKDVT